MIIASIMQMIKLFFFLRLSRNLTKLVIMILNVIIDLRMFLLFYGILLVMLSLILGIIGLGNKEKDFTAKIKPGQETQYVQKFLKNILIMMRSSFGDFEFESVKHLNTFEANCFWMVWVLIVFMTCIVFLNFIIAEVSQSYYKVQKNVEEVICKERASLISESEVMLTKKIIQNPSYFPKYLIMREIEL